MGRRKCDTTVSAFMAFEKGWSTEYGWVRWHFGTRGRPGVGSGPVCRVARSTEDAERSLEESLLVVMNFPRCMVRKQEKGRWIRPSIAMPGNQ